MTSSAATPKGHLVLVRHGETEWSRTGRHTGLTDVDLIPAGVAAARSAGHLLSPWTFGKVICSPLLRARHTAELAGLTPQIDPRLVEWDYGGYEGLTTAQIREIVGHEWTVFEDGVIPGVTPGETIEQVAARASVVLHDVWPTLFDSDVAIVAHGHYLRILTTVYLRQAPRMGAQLLLDPGSVSVLEFERDRPAIRRWNQVEPG